MNTAPENMAASPLSPAQRDLLLEASSSPGKAPHVIGTSVELGANLDAARWEAAAEAVFGSEPGMRLKLVWKDGEPYQALDPQARLVTRRVDLAKEPDADVNAWASRQLEARPDIETDPSFVHALVRDRAGRWNGVLMSPHIFVDGHAYRHFFERTARVYEGAEDGLAAASAGDLFAAAARAASRMDEPETVAFWRERLSDVAPLLFRTRPQTPGRDVEQLLVLPSEDSAAIE